MVQLENDVRERVGDQKKQPQEGGPEEGLVAKQGLTGTVWLSVLTMASFHPCEMPPP